MIYPNPVFIIGTYDDNGVANVMNAAWGGIVSSGPESIGISVRPSRYTFDNLKKRNAFTINLPSADFVTEADYFGMVSGRKVNKLERTGLTPVKAEFVDAPYIEEFPYNVECEVIKTLDIDAHVLFVGKIRDIKIDSDKMTDKDLPDWNKIKPLTADVANNEYRLPGQVVGKSFSDGLKLID